MYWISNNNKKKNNGKDEGKTSCSQANSARVTKQNRISHTHTHIFGALHETSSKNFFSVCEENIFQNI